MSEVPERDVPEPDVPEPDVPEPDVPGPVAADGPGRIPERATHGAAWAMVALGALVGFVLASLSAFDVRVFGPHTIVIAAFGFVWLCAAASGATVAAFVVERAHPEWTPFDRATRIWFLLAGGLLTAFTLWGSWWLLAEAAIDRKLKFVFAIAIVVAAVGGVTATLLAADPNRLNKTKTVRLLTGVKIGVGVALGVFLAIAPVVAVGVVRTTSADVARPDPAPIDLAGKGFVALGDSYSAGEGLVPYDPGTGGVDGSGSNRCHRSRFAYSQQLDHSGAAPDMVFVACSGAVTADLFSPHHQGPSTGGVEVPPQVDLEASPAPDTTVGLVTVTIGGNDVDFSKVVNHCLGHDDCTNAPYGDEVDGVTSSLHDWALHRADELAQELETAYRKLRIHYPAARIVVLGYPYLFPGGDAGVTFSDCDTILRVVSTGERAQLRGLQDELTRRLYAAAVEADVEFVSPVAVWNGHEPCGDRGQYTNAINPIVFDGSFHPNKAGQLAYATLVACYLDTTQRPAVGQRVRLPWETGVTDEAPAPGSLARPVPCPEATPDS